jgi:pSer/pThr/pTyr-binding forkhead associated (FHA) protein
MGFQLVIAEGKEAGREFTFEQTSVVIGRTDECDIVLYDPGVSRTHARIYEEKGSHWVEDMGSSNGTKVNGAVVKRRQLANGDAVAVGPVVFSFTAGSTQDEDPFDGVAGEVTPNSKKVADAGTRIVQKPGDRKSGASSVVPISQARGKAPRRSALAPDNAEPAELQKMSRTRTRTMRAQDVALKLAEADAGESVERETEAAVQRSGPLTAAEKARIRRESPGAKGAIRIFWIEASVAVRNAILAGFALLGLGVLGGVYYLVLAPSDKNQQRLPPEPETLTRKPIPYSFGLGEEVAYKRADQKMFDFEFNAPVKAVVMLHFQSRDISEKEVLVSVNGADVGSVPADTLAVNERSHEIVLPPAALKKGERNQVNFDNVQNPPKSDPWQIWNVWIEVNFLPELPPDQLLREANAMFQRASQTFERRDVGAGNRYEAWKDFRQAWLMLEAHPDPKPELYRLARDKVKETQLQLDNLCSKLMLEADQNFNMNRFDKAGSTLDHVKDYFPGYDQPCQWRAEQKRSDFNL